MIAANRKHAYAPEPWRQPRRDEKPRKVIRKKTKLLTHYAHVGLVLFVFSIAVTLLAHYSVLLGISFQTGRLKREIASLQNEQYHLKLEAARLNSLDRIEAIALKDLGMVYPRAGQYITLTLKR